MSEDQSPLSVEVKRGAPTAEELAAVVAVVTEAYASERDNATVDERPSTSAWARSARGLRTPLDRIGGWSGYGG